jgi:signal transduction histidine kinase
MASLEIIHPADAFLNEHARDVHRVQFYKEEPFLVQSVARHLAASLRDGGSAIVLATKEHRGKILEELVKLEIPTEALLRRYVAHDASEVLAQLMLNDAPDPSRFDAMIRGILRLAQDQPGSAAPVAAFGEMVAVLWAEGKREAAVQLEQLWNEFTRRHSLSLLCAYQLSHFSSADDQGLFARICAEHTSVVPSEGLAELAFDSAKAREIADLQQRAESLALEVEARKIAEARLQATQAELESLVEQRTSSLRKLSLQVLKLQDMERRRIARELHDSLGQEFVGLKVNLDLARRSPHDEELWKRCDALLARCISEVRTLSYLLHPPMIEDAGFASAAEWYIEDFSRRSGMNISFSASGETSRLPEYAKLVLFRAMQEALLNIYRHARATSGEVRVQRCNGTVVLEVKDNGVGIPREKLARFNRNGTGMGVGLTGMRERVRDLRGMFELASGPEGTTVRLSVPLARRG